MVKFWIVIVISGAICIGVVSGCAVTSINPEKVDKEMMKSKKDHSSDKNFSKKKLDEPFAQNSSSDVDTRSWLEEESMTVDTSIYKNSKSNMGDFDLTQKVGQSKNLL